jgi:integrase
VRGWILAPETSRFEAWAADWSSNPAKRSTAWARDESVIRLHLVPTLGARPVATITQRDVQALVTAATGERAPLSVRREYRVLRAIMAAALNADLIARSPCRSINLPSAEPQKPHVVTAEELAALVDALDPEAGPMAYLGAVLGLRWGGCAGLRVGRLDLLAERLEVAEQRTRGRHGGMEDGPPKSDAGRRSMTIPAPLVLVLAELLARRSLTAADADAHVFTMPEGGPLEYAHWRHRIWRPAVKLAKLDGLNFHDLRAASASGMVADGVDVKTAQTRLGHSDPRLTLAIFAQASNAADDAAAERLGERFMPTFAAAAIDGNRRARG